TEPVVRLLDIAQQCVRGLLEHRPGVATVQRGDHSGQQRLGLAVDHHRVHAFLATEVLVHHRFRDVRAVGDLLDRGTVESLLGEDRPRDGQQLLTPLTTRHPYTAYRFAGTASTGLGTLRPPSRSHSGSVCGPDVRLPVAR